MQREHSAVLLTFNKLPFVIEIFVLFIFVAILHKFYCTFNSCHMFQILMDRPSHGLYDRDDKSLQKAKNAYSVDPDKIM